MKTGGNTSTDFGIRHCFKERARMTGDKENKEVEKVRV